LEIEDREQGLESTDWRARIYRKKRIERGFTERKG
jgi:hypothetical protein